MTRKALLIGCPGTKGQPGYLDGVIADLATYKEFLASAFGGAWDTREITTLHDPDAMTIRAELAALDTVHYSFVLFGGHGGIDSRTGRTRVVVRNGSEMDADELRVGAARHTVVIDTCRKFETGHLVEALAKAASELAQIDRVRCRRIFDEQVESSSPGLAVLWACSEGEGAGDEADGGYYSHALVNEAKRWAAQRARAYPIEPSVLTIDAAHDAATPVVHRISGQRQHPKIEKPRSIHQFPFATVA